MTYSQFSLIVRRMTADTGFADLFWPLLAFRRVEIPFESNDRIVRLEKLEVLLLDLCDFFAAVSHE